MKKTLFLLLMSMLAIGTYAGTGASVDDAVEFSWSEGHLQEANTRCWYEVDLSAMPEGYDAMLYVNNVDNDVATITAQPFVKLSSLASLNDPVTKEIVPGRNYAMTLSHAAINALKTKVVYVSLKTNKNLRFSAEPVEPGERDLDCLNAVEFVRTGTEVAAGTTWYAVDIADLKADASKTIRVSAKNQGKDVTTVTAGISFDCPSTATTDVTRSLKAGETYGKTIDRAIIDMLASDLLYIKVQTSQPLYITAEEVEAPVQEVPVIEGEIDFLLDTLYTQSVGAQWYKVNVKELREAKKIAELTLVNTGNTTATIVADVAFSNPATSIVSRTAVLAKGSMTVRDLARNLLESVNSDYAWVRVSTTADIMFSARLKGRTEGTACMAARAFDWENGDWQTGETTVWYAVDITEAKSERNVGKDIMLTVENMSQKTTTLEVQVAFECPYTATTNATRSLGAGATQSKRIERGLYSNLMADVIYVGLTTGQDVRIKASLVDAEETEWSKDCDLEKAVLFDWDNGNDQEANTAVWYKVDFTTIFTKMDTVPEVTVTNLGTGVARIKGELAFDCPALEPTTQRLLALAAGESYVKTPARNLLETLAENVVYIRVETTQPIHIQAQLKKENEGLGCLTAIEFDWLNGNTHPAGKTLWYKIDLTNVKETPGQAVRVGIQNKDGVAGQVSANLYFSCEEQLLYSYQMVLGANARRETDLGRALIMGLKADVVYVELTSEQTDSLYAILYQDVEVEPIEACADALPVEYNVDIEQPKGEQWYYVDLDYLQNFTSGDATLTITNASDASSVLTAQVAWACPVTEQMLDRTLVLEAGVTYTKVLTRALLDGVSNDTAWFCITASEPVTFRLDIVDQRGLSCAAPILFDWVNGNTHSSDIPLWYKVDLDTLRYETDPLHDFRLNVLNLMDESIKASAEIYFDCLDDAAGSLSYDFDANALKYRDIDRDLLETFGWVPILIKFDATGDVHLSAELIEPLPTMIIDTVIVDTICYGGHYNFFRGEDEYNYLIYNDTTWADTVRINKEYDHALQRVDSIATYKISCLKTPELLPVTVAPVVVAGKAIDTSAATQALLQAFAEQKKKNADEGIRLDAEVTDIYWQIQQPSGNRFNNLTGELLDTQTKGVVLRYVILTECEDEVPSEQKIYIAESPLTEQKDSVASVCEGEQFQSRLKTVTITKDTVWTETVYNLVHEQGVQLKDSVYSYQITCIKSPELLPVTVAPVVIAGKAVDTSAATQALLQAFAEQKQANADTRFEADITNLYWQILQSDGQFGNLTENLLDTRTVTVTLRYVILTECGKVLESEAVQYDAEAPLREQKDITDIVCPDTKIQARLGEVVITEDMAWSDTVYNVVHEENVQLKDSIYSYSYRVWKQPVVPAWTQLTSVPASQAGAPVDVTAVEQEIMALVNAAVADDIISVTGIAWQVQDGAGNWVALSDAPVAYDIASLTLRFGLVLDGICDSGMLWGDAEELTVTPATIVVASLVTDTVCAGDTYIPEHGEPRVIEGNTEWIQVEYVGTVENRYPYQISVFQPISLPAVEVLPLAVCGQPVHVEEATAALETALYAVVTDINSTPDEFWWEILSGNDWVQLADNNPALDSNIDEVVLRYVVRTSCNDTLWSETVVLDVQFPTADNTPDMDKLPAVAKYNDWLLMVNLNQINQMGWYPAADDVAWYRVVGELDAIGGEADDVLLATGYYYTIAEKLVGDYYALININPTDSYPCGAALRTVVLHCETTAQTVSIAPTMVAPGETIEISGLDSEAVYTLEVYNLTGVCMQRMEVSGTSIYTFTAQTEAGYYMLNVNDEANMQTLKYIVK